MSHVEFRATSMVAAGGASVPSPAARRRQPAGGATADGVPSAELAGASAAPLARTIEHELVPRLLLAHRAGPFSPYTRALITDQLAVDASAVRADDRHDFLDAVLGDDEDAATALVESLVARGVAVETVYLDLLAPTAVRLGTLWENDECDFLEVTIALGRLQRVLREFSGRFVATGNPETVAGRALLSCLPGEQHSLGLFMVAEFLLRDGWGVQVGTPSTTADLLALVRDEWFDVVGFSAACDTRLLKLRHDIAAVRRHARNPQVQVLVGGRIFVEHPELVARVGADGHAPSAADAPRCARQLLERRASA